MTGFAINPPNAPLVMADGRTIDPAWYKFFLAIQRRIGGPSDPFDEAILLAGLPETPGVGSDAELTGARVLVVGEDSLPPPVQTAPPFEDTLAPYTAQRVASLPTRDEADRRYVRQSQGAAWTAATGTAARTALASYAGQTVSAAYVQAEAQATDNAVKAVSQALVALINDLRANGALT